MSLILRLSKKLRYRACKGYTWLLKGGLKSCGERVYFEFPVRIEQPQSVSIGNDVVCYPRVWINPVLAWAGIQYQGEVVLHDRVKIGYGVQISAAGSIVIEEDVAIGAGAVIVDHIHDHRHLEMPIFNAPLSKPEPVRIGKGSFLGVYCFIGPGVQIGEHSVVAANAVVTRNVPPYSTAIGNPARIIPFHFPDEQGRATDQNCGVGFG